MKAFSNPIVAVAWALIALAGCQSAGIVWSPDGKQGIYTIAPPPKENSRANGYVIDSTGKIVASLGPVCPTMALFGLSTIAWTADSALAYFAAITDDPTELRLERDWKRAAVEPPAPTVKVSRDKPVDSVLTVWDGKTTTKLASLPGFAAMMIRVSSDGKWVAILGGPGDQGGGLFAYCTGSKKLYRVEQSAAGLAMCFTGGHRLSYVRVNSAAATDRPARGKLVELDLNESDETIAPVEVMDVYLEGCLCLNPAPAAGPEGLMFLAWPQTMTGGPLPDPGKTQIQPMSLYRWDRKAKKSVEVAENLLTIEPSPDGKSLLCFAADKEHPIELRDADGSHRREMTGFETDNSGLMPTWHGNDHITTNGDKPVRQPNADGTFRQVWELVDRPIGPDVKLGAQTDLSREWKPEMKPWTPADPKPVPARQ